MNIETTTKVFTPNQIHPGIQLNKTLSMGDIQPPKNMMTAKIETNHMLAYSAKKKIAKPMPEYSTM